MSQRDLQRMMEELRANVGEDIRTAVAPQIAAAAQGNNEQLFDLFNWGDGLIGHAVPQGFIFPKNLTVSRLACLWHFGDRAQRIRPYRFIVSKFDLKASSGCTTSYSRAKCVMKKLHEIVTTTNLMLQQETINNLSACRHDIVFEAAIRTLFIQLDIATGRNEDVAYSTAYVALARISTSNTKTGKLKRRFGDAAE